MSDASAKRGTGARMSMTEGSGPTPQRVPLATQVLSWVDRLTQEKAAQDLEAAHHTRRQAGQDHVRREAERQREATTAPTQALLPERLACPDCGVAVPTAPLDPAALTARTLTIAGHGPVRQIPSLVKGRSLGTAPIDMTYVRCAPCHERAQTSPAPTPDRLALALVALAAAGLPAPTIDPAERRSLIEHLAPLGHGARWCSSAAGRQATHTGQPSLSAPTPWRHVTAAHRAAIKQAYAAVLADRVDRLAPPVTIKPPDIYSGCAICGVDHVTATARQVRRLGGRQKAPQALWYASRVYLSTIGGPGSPDPTRYVACPPCAEAIKDAGGLTHTAIERAYRRYLGDAPLTLSRRVKSYAALRSRDPSTQPSSTPWAHMGGQS